MIAVWQDFLVTTTPAAAATTAVAIVVAVALATVTADVATIAVASDFCGNLSVPLFYCRLLTIAVKTSISSFGRFAQERAFFIMYSAVSCAVVI